MAATTITIPQGATIFIDGHHRRVAYPFLASLVGDKYGVYTMMAMIGGMAKIFKVDYTEIK